MELLLEIIGEFILEILMEAKNNKHIPFIIRIFMILILTLFYIGIAFLFLIIGINAIKTNIFLGLLSILISLFLLFFIFYNDFSCIFMDYQLYW